MIRKKKLYSKPRKLYIKSRISQENALMIKYALKNKREIWKALAKIKYFRKRAMALAKASPNEQNILFGKLKIIGLNTNTIADVLALNVESLLERRLPTIVFKKKLASTPQHARQLVTHKKIFVDGKIISVPSYIVSVKEEPLISIKPSKKLPLQKKAENAKSAEPEEDKNQKNDAANARFLDAEKTSAFFLNRKSEGFSCARESPRPEERGFQDSRHQESK